MRLIAFSLKEDTGKRRDKCEKWANDITQEELYTDNLPILKELNLVTCRYEMLLRSTAILTNSCTAVIRNKIAGALKNRRALKNSAFLSPSCSQLLRTV